jgi:cell division septation protein DedD
VKGRLTGAIILVAVFVLLVPELLSGPVRPSPRPPTGSGTLAANPSEEPPLRSYTINLADDARSRAPAASDGSTTPQPSGPAQPTSPPQSSSNPAATGSGGPQSGDGSAGGSAQSSDDSIPSGGSAQQGGAAPSGGNGAPGDIAQPGEAAQPAIPVPRAAPRGPGPLQASRPLPSNLPAQRASSRPAAAPDKASKSRLASAAPSIPAGSSARTPESASGSGESASGWMVQLGVFASRANAEHLAQEMKAKGFRASVSGVTMGSRALYRVRVGPAADRAAAHELQGRLRSAGRAGTLVPHS